MPAVTKCDWSTQTAGPVDAPWRAHRVDVERFSHMLNEKNSDGCKSSDDAPGKGRDFASEQYSVDTPTHQNMLHLLGATSPGDAIRKNTMDIREAAGRGAPPRSAILTELTKVLADRILVGGDEADDSTVLIVHQGELLGDTQVTISFRDDTLRVFIESERLSAILQSQGNAFASELSNRLGLRILVTVAAHSSGLEQQHNYRQPHGLDPVLHFVAEKGT